MFSICACVKREGSRERKMPCSKKVMVRSWRENRDRPRASEGEGQHVLALVHKNRQSDCKYTKREMEAAESDARQRETDGKRIQQKGELRKPVKKKRLLCGWAGADLEGRGWGEGGPILKKGQGLGERNRIEERRRSNGWWNRERNPETGFR